MSDLSDPCDFASLREDEIRADGVAEIRTALAEQAAIASAFECRVCDEPIPELRRLKVPGVQTCVACQEEIERALEMKGL